jgi:high-affinity K+ transport system ATPase subunit B
MVGIKDIHKPKIYETFKKFKESNIQTIICTGDTLEATKTFVDEKIYL